MLSVKISNASQVAGAEPERTPRVGMHAKLVDHDHREVPREARRIFRRSRSDAFVDRVPTCLRNFPRK